MLIMFVLEADATVIAINMMYCLLMFVCDGMNKTGCWWQYELIDVFLKKKLKSYELYSFNIFVLLLSIAYI